jgi:hypothetical protein
MRKCKSRVLFHHFLGIPEVLRPQAGGIMFIFSVPRLIIASLSELQKNRLCIIMQVRMERCWEAFSLISFLY